MDIEAMKARSRHIWGLGDYSDIERLTGQAAQPLVDACAISAGQEVLDVAAGSGNVAIAAASEGARVVASDLSPAMLERARERARVEGVDLELVEADAEALPFADESFECVASAFGAMLAPRPEVMVGEVFRVLRPGGTFGMTAWTPSSLIPEQTALVGRYLPQPEGVPASSEWGDPDIVHARLDGVAGSLRMERRTAEWAGGSVEEYVDALQSKAGPFIAVREAMDEEPHRALTADLLELVRSHARGAGPITIPMDYLLIVARKRG